MSYDQLDQHALEIQRLAYEIALSDHDRAGVVDDGMAPKATADLLFGDIPDLFTPFLRMPSPRHFAAPLASLDLALMKIAHNPVFAKPFAEGAETYLSNKALDKMSVAQQYLSRWTGAAAEEFVRNFVVPFPSINDNQFLLLLALRQALHAQQAIWTQTQRDIDVIAEQTIGALESLEGLCPGRNDWPITFTVAACVIALPASAIPGVGVGAILAFQFLSTAAWVAAANPPAAGPKSEITGSTVPDVITSMHKAVSELTRTVAEQQNIITTNVRNALRVLDGNRRAVTFDHVPTLLGLSPKDRTGPAGLGYAN